jgi:glycosyltransferase involved in cell wall biosynthesis
MLSRSLAEGQLSCIPNAWAPQRDPLDASAARSALGIGPDGGFQIGWVGRLEREKGPDVLLEALALLRDVSWQATLIGEGQELATLQQLAMRLGLADRVRFHGAVADAARLYRAFDVVALSSRTEGTPIVLFEAMAAGTPVVATAVGGVPDVVTDSTAVLVPSEDPAALSRALRDVFVDRPAACRRAERAAGVLGERYAAGAWLQAYEALYLRVARRRGVPGTP